MYTTSDLKKGLKIEIDGEPYAITEFNFQKPGKGQAVYTCKLRNLLNGSTVTKTYRSGDKAEEAHLESKTLMYSYPEADRFVFMDENYEQVPIPADILGDARYFLDENMSVEALFFRGGPIEVSLPTFVEKEVVKTEPGAKGNTATNVTKPATVTGGYEVQVPLFIKEGDVLRIDTRTGEYTDRVARK